MNILLRKYILKYLEVKGMISANLHIILRERRRIEKEERRGKGGRSREEMIK